MLYFSEVAHKKCTLTLTTRYQMLSNQYCHLHVHTAKSTCLSEVSSVTLIADRAAVIFLIEAPGRRREEYKPYLAMCCYSVIS